VPFDDAAKTEFVNLIVSMLELQKLMAGNAHGSIEDENGHLKRKAVGYVYGYVDAALRSIGQALIVHAHIGKWPNAAYSLTRRSQRRLSLNLSKKFQVCPKNSN